MDQTRRETITVGALAVRFLVLPEDSGGSVSVFECFVPAAARMPAPHSHDAFEETIYGLSGVTNFDVGGDRIALTPGDAVHIPRGVVHGFDVGDDGAAFLAVATPGVFGSAYFRQVADVIAASAGPPDPQRLMAVMRRHGLTPAPPAWPWSRQRHDLGTVAGRSV
jgi:quercetin dioxygenase-like cupin family protein